MAVAIGDAIEGATYFAIGYVFLPALQEFLSLGHSMGKFLIWFLNPQEMLF